MGLRSRSRYYLIKKSFLGSKRQGGIRIRLRDPEVGDLGLMFNSSGKFSCQLCGYVLGDDTFDLNTREVS